MANDHGSSVKDDKQYEGLRKKGMSKERAARIANDPSRRRRAARRRAAGSATPTRVRAARRRRRLRPGRKGGKASS